MTPNAMMDAKQQLQDILNELRFADDDGEEEIGRARLSSWLHANPELVDFVISRARQDNALRRCLMAARYYSGLPSSTCDKIDKLARQPF